MAGTKMNHIALTAIIVATLIICFQTKQSSQLPERKRSRTEVCGGAEDLAAHIEKCAKPVMDIVEGNLEKWPRTLNDTEVLCEDIHKAEKCIRDESRRCAQGLQKTIVSTVASSIQRSRKRECSKDKHPGVLRMVNCIEKHTKDTKKLIATVVTNMTVVETQMFDLDKKTNGICCAVKTLETDLRVMFDRICPADTPTMMRLYRGVLDDVLDLVCRSAKCHDDIYKGYKIPTKLNYDNGKLIATLLRIVFSLDG